MSQQSAVSNQQSVNPAAIRHAVYCDVLGLLPWASAGQAERMAANLRLDDGGRRLGTVLLRVSFDLRETAPQPVVMLEAGKPALPVRGLAEVERYCQRFGEYLEFVPGFYRRRISSQQSAISNQTECRVLNADGLKPPWRLNLPTGCAFYGYRSATGHVLGILCQPLNKLNSFFLLSSAKYGGPKAARLTPADEQYFTQFEEVTV